MNLLNQLLICILITCRCSRANQFLSWFDKFIVPINFKCQDNSLINILDMHLRTARENKKFSLYKEIPRKNRRKCSMQQTCKTFVYNDSPPRKYELVINYHCVEAESVVSLCQNSLERKYRGAVYLVQYALRSPNTDSCTCVATYSGNSYVSLTYISTIKNSLNVTTWKSYGETNNRTFTDRMYENEIIADNPEKQEFTFENIPSEDNDEDSFTLVKIEATEDKSYVQLNCDGHAGAPAPKGETTENPTHANGTDQAAPLTSTFVVAILCIIGISVLAFILYHRHMKRKMFKQSSVTPRETGTNTESARHSLYIDARLRNSYAEVESISDYRHYICLDDISQQSVTLTVQYDTGDQGSIQNNIPGVTEQQGLDSTLRSEQRNCIVSRPDQEYHREFAGRDSNMTSDCKDNDDKVVRRSFVNICSRSTSRMISQEHYDLSGYLSLNTTERTTNASLKKWKKEIYSVEKAAREICKNRQTAAADENSVGQSKVRIVFKPPSNKPQGYPYHYVNNQGIKFDETEVYTIPDIDKKRPPKE